MLIKKFPWVAVVATKLNFLQYTYRFMIDHKTLYSQTFPGPHFGSWTTGTVLLWTWACLSIIGAVIEISQKWPYVLVSELQKSRPITLYDTIYRIFRVSQWKISEDPKTRM